MASTDWQFLETELYQEGSFRIPVVQPQPPLRLISLTIRQQGGMSLTPGAVFLDDLQVKVDSSEQPVILERFEGVGSLGVIKDTPPADGDSPGEQRYHRSRRRRNLGSLHLGVGLHPGDSGVVFGNAGEMEQPLRIIVGKSFLEQEGVSRGDQVQLWVDGHRISGEIADAVEYFPTLDPSDDGFMVVSLPALLQRLNTAESDFERQPNELWLNTGLSGSAREGLVGSLGERSSTQVSDRGELLALFQADPLVAAGWDGILTLAFIAVLFATLMGFSVYSYVQAQRRRVEFAMLRSIGLSFRGLVAIVLLEQVIVVVIGLGLGSWMGVQLTTVLMPFLGLTEQGTQVLPPFAVEVNWPAIIATYSIMAIVFLGVMVSLIGVFSRTAIHRALRFGEI